MEATSSSQTAHILQAGRVFRGVRFHHVQVCVLPAVSQRTEWPQLTLVFVDATEVIINE
jgi:hypothetical protein